MKIGIDASRANKDHKTGVEWYSYYLIEELKKMTPEAAEVVLYTNESLQDNLAKMPAHWKERKLSWPPKYLWTQIRLWWELCINPPDVFFVPAHTIPLLPIPKKIKVICVVHDVGFKRFPYLYKKIQFWYHHITMLTIKWRANVIITISQFSKDEIIDLYHVNPDKVVITYLGYDTDSYHRMTASQEVKNISRPYLLYVGRIEKKKNIYNIIDAFAEVYKTHPEMKLVLAGNPGNEQEHITRHIAELKLEKNIIIPGYVAEADMPQLMASAECLVFPTLYEGFGLPLVQAMACGTPVVTSSHNPHREIVDGAGILVDPLNPHDIARGILSLVENQELRNQICEKGIARAQNFSWKKTAENTLAILIDRS